MVIVGMKDVTVRLGLVSRYAWLKAHREGALRPLKMRFKFGRNKYLADHVEQVFGLPKGSVREAR